MSHQSKKQHLEVFLHGKHTGRLYSDNATLSFVYDESYLNSKKPTKLSASMPLQKEAFGHQVTAAFFSGLLPDEYVRKRLARYLRLSEKNIFSLLKEIGGECAGAVSVYREGSSPETRTKPTYKVLEDNEAHDVLSQLDKRPMMAGEDDIRISGAGAQDKLIIAIVDGKIAIPTHDTPSTHIIKPAIKDIDETVQNEFFCMQLAKKIGFPVPSVAIHWLAGDPYFLVERYDRRCNADNSIQRLHQEDFCQALHIEPEYRYENEGGPSLAHCFKLLDERIQLGVMAGKNKLTFLQAIIFNFLIGNGDAHGKNFSLLYDGEVESLAPLYDLMSTLVYTNGFKATMAMKLGREYKFKNITIAHFDRLSEISNFKPEFIQKQLYKLSHDIRIASAALLEELNGAFPIYGRIVNLISQQCHQVASGDMPVRG